jgi:hypothetical protein
MSISKITQALLQGGSNGSAMQRTAQQAATITRSVHGAQAMQRLNSVPPDVKELIDTQCHIVTKRVFSNRYSSVEDDFKKMHTAKPIAQVPHNGNEVRVAYHDCLADIDMHISQGVFQSILGQEEEYGAVIPALLKSTLREKVRMCAWSHMTAQEGVRLLRDRNLEVHGREEGPSVEILLEKYAGENPEMTEEQLWSKIGGKGLTSTSQKYDKDFGAIAVAIQIKPNGEVESASERLRRIVEEASEESPKASL